MKGVAVLGVSAVIFSDCAACPEPVEGAGFRKSLNDFWIVGGPVRGRPASGCACLSVGKATVASGRPASNGMAEGKGEVAGAGIFSCSFIARGPGFPK